MKIDHDYSNIVIGASPGYGSTRRGDWAVASARHQIAFPARKRETDSVSACACARAFTRACVSTCGKERRKKWCYLLRNGISSCSAPPWAWRKKSEEKQVRSSGNQAMRKRGSCRDSETRQMHVTDDAEKRKYTREPPTIVVCFFFFFLSCVFEARIHNYYLVVGGRDLPGMRWAVA